MDKRHKASTAASKAGKKSTRARQSNESLSTQPTDGNSEALTQAPNIRSTAASKGAGKKSREARRLNYIESLSTQPTVSSKGAGKKSREARRQNYIQSLSTQPTVSSNRVPTPPPNDSMNDLSETNKPGAVRVRSRYARNEEEEDEETTFPEAEQTVPQVSNENDDAPYVVEATRVDDQEVVMGERVDEDKAKRNRNRLFVAGFVSAAVIAGAVAGGVVGTRSSRETQAPTLAPTLPPPTEPPTLAPTSRPVFSSEELIAMALSERSPDGGAALRTPGSPQNEAFQWLTTNNANMTELDTVQRYALAVVYYALGGGNWTVSRNWLSDEDVCNWAMGAPADTICNDEGELLSLKLDRNELRGTVPEEIALLSSQLQLFDVTLNAINGTLPVAMADLSNLEIFFVEANSMTGTIPTEYGRLTKLINFYIDANMFSGRIPDEICELKTNHTLDKLWADCQELTCDCCRCCTEDEPCLEGV